MTRKRNDSHSTEFGLWLRDQETIDSKLGYVTTNIDYMWENYKTGEWVLIEEKRYNAELSYSQKKQFKKLASSIKKLKYKGFYLITFEKTSPEDGKIYIENILKGGRSQITKEQLLKFLRFDWSMWQNS